MDRNVFLTLTVPNIPVSLSARRAWIEIAIVNTVISCIMGRSPQGERG